MPKKFGINTKKEEAKERKQQKKIEEQTKIVKQIEDEYWQETDKKAIKKIEREKEKEQKRQETIQRKKENKELLEKEEMELDSQTKTVQKQPITKAKIEQAKEKELERILQKIEEKAPENEQYTEEIDVEQDFQNDNFRKMEEHKEMIQKDIDVIEGSGIDSVLDSMQIGTKVSHPEKKVKSAWNVFLEKKMPEYKKAYPKFRRNKLMDMIHQEFEKSPENPLYVAKLQEQREKYKNMLIEERKEKEGDYEDEEV